VKTELLYHPFALGFYLGCVFLILALYQYVRLKGEFRRYKNYLSDKLQIEAESMQRIKGEQETLRKENENLRVKVNSLNDSSDRKLQRDLEIYARAEKRMLISAPGFAPAWETAKSEAHHELSEEESGKAQPKRIFARLFGASGGTTVALPAAKEEPKPTPPADSDNGHRPSA
jgi:hypothetical protein